MQSYWGRAIELLRSENVIIISDPNDILSLSHDLYAVDDVDALLQCCLFLA